MTAAAPRERLSERPSARHANDGSRRRRTTGRRAVSRTVTLLLAVGFAVVGVAGAASAHHNTITGAAVCKAGGGWTVTWRVVNSENISETITASSRTSVVPVGTQLTAHQARTFTEKWLAEEHGPFTVQTGTDRRGDYYAQIFNAEGADLGDDLVSANLGRLVGS